MFADLIEPADPDKYIGQDYLREEELRLCLEGQIKCKFPWNNNYIVDRNFWIKLVCLDLARKGWLTEEESSCRCHVMVVLSFVKYEGMRVSSGY
nr:phospholipase-like protein [Tanacetum cinerariifolium]